MTTRVLASCFLVLILFAGAAPAGGAAGPVVLFDEGHGQRARVRGDGPLELSGFGAIVSKRGGRPRASTGELTRPALTDVRALIVSGASEKLRDAEVEAIVAFLEKGGRLAVMIQVEPPQAALLHRLGVSISNGVVRDPSGALAGDPLSYRVTRLRPHPLTRGLSGFAVHGAWALLPTAPSAEVIAETSPQAWVDLNGNGRLDPRDAKQAFAVAVAGRRGSGRFAVFGDDAMFQNKLLTGDNRRLAENLADWLQGPDASPVSPVPAHH